MNLSVSRLRRVRQSSSRSAASCPWTGIEPERPPSSSPTAWRKVDLPEPDGPSKPTISPRFTSRSTPRRTSIVTSPWVKLRLSPRVMRTVSLITQYLDRIGARGLQRRKQRRGEDQDERDNDNRRDFYRIGLGRKLSEDADRRVPRVRAAERMN